MELATDIVEKKKFTSGNGAEYEVGYSVEVGTNDNDMQAEGGGSVGASDPGFNVNVNWPVGSRDWKPTTPDVYQKTGITKYYLIRDQSVRYDYTLAFKCDASHDFRFIDEGKDSYPVGAFRPGEYQVYYNSDKPTIVQVCGV